MGVRRPDQDGKVSELRERADRVGNDYQRASEQVVEERERLTAAKGKHGLALEAQELLQTVAQTVQASAHAQIARVVSRCLEAVFGDAAYEFRIGFERKRGRTEAVLEFLRDGHAVSPTEAAGGGVVDVASLALRMACLVLQRPSCRRLLVLDEPFGGVAADRMPLVGQLVEVLSKEMDVQFLIVTHSPALEVGKVIRIGG